MIYSMTGYADTGGQCGNRYCTVELRTVNHRYLDIHFKLADEVRHLESTLREMIAAQIQRGKVECRIQIQSNRANGACALHVCDELLEQLVQLNQNITQKFNTIQPLSVSDILHFPGVLITEQEDAEAVNQGILALMQQSLSRLQETRLREGAQLRQHLLTRLAEMDTIIQHVLLVFPSLLQKHFDKVEERLREAVAQIDAERLKQEFVLFMQKTDVDEELSRLQTHIDEVQRLLSSNNGSVGKRLDFLMQELNREANTLGSKAISAECSQASVGLKVLIEQMREQVQNIE
ncbi:YicC/YloC family endoribonuclease [Stenoxybacter acetivorans]|uniref:YicC/YloC family endoribonuclease n=1 Tax=Stenoxybacter acetivorans TaxID=422441 RepID=UPI001FE16A77|nr:YicC/YloC family endoribonuclease [Stenoxybacter acetivorans]